MARGSPRLYMIRLIYSIFSAIIFSALSIGSGMLATYFVREVLGFVFTGNCLLFGIASVYSIVAVIRSGYDLILSYSGEKDI